MMDKRCLICAGATDNGLEYHPQCSRSFFGSYPPPSLDIRLEELKEYAAQSVLARITVTGVQKKLSLNIEKQGKNTRFTIVGLWGGFILKPPVDEYPFLPENEDTIMRLASVAGIPVVPHGIVRLASGELAFISKRIDRDKENGKIAMEDFCQISGRLTEDKYKGSVERVGKLLRQYSVFPGLDVVDLCERVIVNYLCGNADMHLKNYSLIETPDGMRLAPAYDLVSTALALPQDQEESALTINGKKSRLSRDDFDTLCASCGIAHPAKQNIYSKIANALEKMISVVKSGLLPQPMKTALCDMIVKRMGVFQ